MRFIIPPTYLKLLLLLCTYISTYTLYAQEQEIDSLAQYSYEELDDLYLKHLYDESGKARIYADKLFLNAKKSNNQNDLFEANRRYAVLEKNQGNYQKALDYLSIAKNIATKELKNKSLETLCVFLEGQFSYQHGKYEEAFEYYNKAYDFYNRNNEYMTYMVSHNIALVKNVLGDQKGALKILLKNYNDFKAASEEERNYNFNRYSFSNTLMALSDTYLKYALKENITNRSLLDSADIYINLGLKESKRINDDLGYTSFLTGQGILAHERGNQQEALSKLATAEIRAISEKNKTQYPSIYYYTGMSYKSQNDYDNAIKFLRKVDSVSQKNAINYPLLDKTYHTLINLYNKKGDKENALKYWSAFEENNRINEHVSKNVKDAIHRDYDIKELETLIDQLASSKKANYNAALVIIITLLLLFLIYFFYSKNKQLQNKIKFDKLLTELESKKEEIPITQEKGKSTLTIDEEKVQQILAALAKFEDKKQFLDVNCDLAFVAKKVKTNKAYLSKVIHSEKQQKFIQYITNLRINYALEKLKEDKLFRSYDIKSIASELGFKSPDSFSRAFKNKTGIYPSYYIKNINKINTSEEI
ncbi:helix-turn-helix domain-containing protein [uncultured Kordia sp.]|uniref:helix-turn-helix domain-containing protein n=1 Tax=uncultured Kordia sp. TaxID=507699 RepID=UPI0026094704|nr:helix-turn-helix domain-containing protein [uncultured Kordia sp.]